MCSCVSWSQRLPLRVRRGGRAVEGARLEIVYTATYRGFESLSLRHVHLLPVPSHGEVFIRLIRYQARVDLS